MKITVLGSGTSTGVPEIGCTCEVCQSTDPRDKRLRCSALVEENGVRILIDCSPDFREQMLRFDDYRPIDAVIITHEHHDHVGGIDDLRAYCKFHPITLFAEPNVAKALHARLPYCFGPNLYPGVPQISIKEISPATPFCVSNTNGHSVKVMPLRVMHGKLPIVGFRIGSMTWITDMLTMPDESYDIAKGSDLLFINGLRRAPHPTHQSIEEALTNISRLNPSQAYLIHFSHQAGLHAQWEKELPPHVHFSYDGLQALL